MKKTDLAYFAGIFDGEGCIIIRKGRSGYHTAMATLTNTNEWICRQFQFSFGGSVYMRSPQGDRRQAIWAWSVEAQKAQGFLEIIVPYLKLKRAQAEIAIGFAKRVHKQRGYRLTAGELAIREAEKLLISNYNKPLQSNNIGGKTNAVL